MGTYTEKADVYSFGVIVSELFGQKPFDYSNYVFIYEIIQLVKKQEMKPQLPPNCPHDIARLILQCIEIDPNNRPSSLEVWNMLKKIDL